MKVSKNQVVWAACHFAGEASANGWTVESASLSGASRSSVSLRVAKSLSPSALRAEAESSRAIAALTAMKESAGQHNSSLFVLLERLFVASRARSPENVAAFLRRNIAGSDEQQIRQAVEVGQQLRVERLAFVERDRGSLGAADDG